MEVMGERESGRSRYLVSWKGRSLLHCLSPIVSLKGRKHLSGEDGG